MPGRIKRGRFASLRKKAKAGARSRSERSLAPTLVGRTRSRRLSASVSLAKIFRESTGVQRSTASGETSSSLSFLFLPCCSFVFSHYKSTRVFFDFGFATTTGDFRGSCGPKDNSSSPPDYAFLSALL